MRQSANHHMTVLILTAIFTTTISPGIIVSQELHIKSVQDSLVKQFNQVKDYRAELEISIDIPRLKMPRKRVEVYYKQPDKIKVDGTGLIMAPKFGFIPSPELFFGQLTDPVVVSRQPGEIVIEGKIIPDPTAEYGTTPRWKGEHNVQMNMRLVVDTKRWLIQQSDIRLEGKTINRVEINYREVAGDIWLPATTKVTFDLPSSLISRPGRQLNPDTGDDFTPGDATEAEAFGGTIQVDFLHYRVNTGLSDWIFRE